MSLYSTCFLFNSYFFSFSTFSTISGFNKCYIKIIIIYSYDYLFHDVFHLFIEHFKEVCARWHHFLPDKLVNIKNRGIKPKHCCVDGVTATITHTYTRRCRHKQKQLKTVVGLHSWSCERSKYFTLFIKFGFKTCERRTLAAMRASMFIGLLTTPTNSAGTQQQQRHTMKQFISWAICFHVVLIQVPVTLYSSIIETLYAFFSIFPHFALWATFESWVTMWGTRMLSRVQFIYNGILSCL